jgi:hypothetical protein
LRLVFVFVGASLLANRAGKSASPQAKIRWQASSYRGKVRPAGALRLVFVGASLLANRAGKRASPQGKIRWQASSYKNKMHFPCRSQPAGESCQ